MTTKTKNIPKLRFNEFSEEWVEKTLDNIADVKGGKRIPKGYTLQKGRNSHPYITVSDMGNMTVELNNIQYVPDHVFPLIKNYTITSSDIYISVAGTLGLVGIVPEVLNGANLTENADKLENIKCNQLFLLYYLSTPKFRKLIDSSKTDNAQPKLAIYIIKSFQVLLPSKLEQQKIADFLSSVDKKIQHLKQKKQLLEQYKKGMMQKLFSQQIRFKDEDGLDYPEWKEIILYKYFDFYRGETLSKADLDKHGKNMCIHYGELFTFYKEVAVYIQSKTNLEYKKKSVVGDILMPSSDVTPDGLAKATALMINNVILGGDINILRLKDKLNSAIFFSYMINYFKTKIMKIVTGTTVKHLYNSDLKNLTYNVPVAFKEQQKIADFLSCLDKKIDYVNSQITQTEQFKKGLLQQLLV